MNLKIKRIKEDAVVPFYATEGSVGLDLSSISEYNVKAGEPQKKKGKK